MDIRLLSAGGLSGPAAVALASAREGKFDAIVGALTASTLTTDEIDVTSLRTSEVTAEAFTVPSAGLISGDIEIAIGRSISVLRDPSYTVNLTDTIPGAVIDDLTQMSYKAPFKFVPGQVFQYVLEGQIESASGDHAVYACPWFVEPPPADVPSISANGNALLRISASLGPMAFALRTTITVIAATTSTVTYKYASVVTNGEVIAGDIEAIYTTAGTATAVPYDAGGTTGTGNLPYMVFAFYPNAAFGAADDVGIAVLNHYVLQLAGPSGYVAPL